MPDATHATIATFRLDPGRDAEQTEALQRFIVPSVRQAPGLIHGYWTRDASAEEQVVFLAFTSMADAESFVANVRANQANQEATGVHLVEIRVVEIAAET